MIARQLDSPRPLPGGFHNALCEEPERFTQSRLPTVNPAADHLLTEVGGAWPQSPFPLEEPTGQGAAASSVGSFLRRNASPTDVAVTSAASTPGAHTTTPEPVLFFAPPSAEQ